MSDISEPVPGARFGSIINELARWGSSELINLSHAIGEIVDRRGAARQPSLKQIKEAVAAASGIAVELLSSERRDLDVRRPRKVAMALCKHFTLAGYPRIARSFERQPGAARRACRKLEPLIAFVGKDMPADATVKDWAVNMLAAYEQVVGQD